MLPEGPWSKKWTVERQIGEGVQGTAWLLAPSSGEQSRAVLKLLKNKDKTQPRLRMYREVTSLKIVSNVGGKVPRVLETNAEQFGEPGTRLYMVTEFIDGETLKKLVERTGGFGLDEAIEISLAIGDTIDRGTGRAYCTAI